MVVIQISSKDNKTPEFFTFTNYGKTDVKVELVDINNSSPVNSNVLKPYETKVFHPPQLCNDTEGNKDVLSAKVDIFLTGGKNLENLFINKGDFNTKATSTNFPERIYFSSDGEEVVEVKKLKKKYPKNRCENEKISFFQETFNTFDLSASETNLIRDLALSAKTFSARASLMPQYLKQETVPRNPKLKSKVNPRSFSSSYSTSSSENEIRKHEGYSEKIVSQAKPSTPAMPMIENFHLPPRTYVTALIQDPYEETSKIRGSYTITNNGNCNIEAEIDFHKIIHNKKTPYRVIVKSKKTKNIEVKNNFHVSSLKIINRSFREIANFSASGGLIYHNLVDYIEQLPSQNVKRLKEISKFQMLPLTSIIPMIQPRGFKTFSRPGNYTVTNNGRSNIIVEVFNDDSDTEDIDTFFNDIVRPNETRVIELLDDFGHTSLRISNHDVKKIAIFSAKGGYVINDFWHKVTKLPETSKFFDSSMP